MVVAHGIWAKGTAKLRFAGMRPSSVSHGRRDGGAGVVVSVRSVVTDGSFAGGMVTLRVYAGQDAPIVPKSPIGPAPGEGTVVP